MLAGLAALAIAMGVGRFAFTPILPMMQQDNGLSLAQGSWLAALPDPRLFGWPWPIFGTTAAASALLTAILVGGTFVVITMVAMQEARRVAGGDAPALMAALTAAFALGQIVGPLSVPLLVSHGGFAAALLTASGLLALSALLLPGERR